MSVIISYNGAFVVTRQNGDMKDNYGGFYIFDTLTGGFTQSLPPTLSEGLLQATRR